MSFKTSGDGTLTPTSVLDLALDGIGNKGWVVDNSGNYLYAFTGANNSMRIFRIDQGSGALVETSHSPLAISMPTAGDIAVSPENILYVAARNILAAYSIDSVTGDLSLLGSAVSGSAPIDISIDRSGTFIYVADDNTSSVFAFSVDAKGVPHAVAGSPFPLKVDSGTHLTGVLAD